MGEPVKARWYHRRRQDAQAALFFCLVVLVMIAIVLLVLYFVLFRPKDPKIEVQSVQLQSLALGSSSGSNGSVEASLVLSVWLRNPNRATFYFTDNRAYITYRGIEVAVATIPAGRQHSRSSAYLNVYLTADGLNSVGGPYLGNDVAAGLIRLTAIVSFAGHVTAINLFTHHGIASANCEIRISVPTRSIISYNCNYNIWS